MCTVTKPEVGTFRKFRNVILKTEAEWHFSVSHFRLTVSGGYVLENLQREFPHSPSLSVRV
jgi:hypothetical protein